jgi:inhibitor of cysteine peptidase
LVAITLIGAACSDDGPKVVTLQADDTGKTIKLSSEDTLDVVLEGNPSTGYTWEIEESENPKLTLMGEPHFEAGAQIPGAGGVFTFKFEVAESGTGDLRLIYHRTWETEPPARTFEVTVEID